MTPLEILESVKSRFPVLLHNESEKLLPLLYQAMTTYQDKAGVCKKVLVKQEDVVGGIFELPDLFLNRIHLKNGAGRFMRHTVLDDEVALNANDLSVASFPLVFSYLVCLGELTKEELSSYQLPKSTVGLISDYLHVLIQIPNADRQRNAMISGGFDASSIPTEADLVARKRELEEDMKRARSFISMVTL